MRKTAFSTATLVAAIWLGLSAVHAGETQSAKIKRLQFEAKIAQLNAQAEAERVAAYEEAWRKTKAAAKGAACIAGGLYAGPLVGAVCYAHNTFRNK